MSQQAPEKILISAPTRGDEGIAQDDKTRCVWMAMNTLEKVAAVLENGANEIQVAPDMAARARLPIQRMLDFAAEMRKKTMARQR